MKKIVEGATSKGKMRRYIAFLCVIVMVFNNIPGLMGSMGLGIQSVHGNNNSVIELVEDTYTINQDETLQVLFKVNVATGSAIEVEGSIIPVTGQAIESGNEVVTGGAISVTAESMNTDIFTDDNLVVDYLSEEYYSLTAIPVLNALGTGKIKIIAEDEFGQIYTREITVFVSDPMLPVVDGIPVLELDQGSNMTLNLDDYCTDPEGLSLSYSIQVLPTEGEAVIEGSLLTYTADQDAGMSDQFVVRVSNGNKYTDVTIQVDTYSMPVIPIQPHKIVINEDEPEITNLDSLCVDIQGRVLEYTVLTAPEHGVTTVTGSALTFTPKKDYFGDDQITISVSNGKNSGTFVIEYQIEPVEDPPIAVTDTVTVGSGKKIIIDVLANDIVVDHGSELELLPSLVTPPQKAKSCEVKDGKIHYQPDPRESGSDSLVYQIRHKNGSLLAFGTVNIQIYSENQPPEVSVDHSPMEINEDETLSFTLNIKDMDSLDIENDFDISLVSSNTAVFQNGVYILSAPTIISQDEVSYIVSWQPEQFSNTTEHGAVEMTLTVTDKNDPTSKNTVTFSVEVYPVNNPPEIKGLNDSYSMSEDGTLTIDFTVYDPDVADPLKDFAITYQSANQSVLADSGITLSKPVLVDSRTAKYTLTLKPVKDKNSADGFNIEVTAKDNGSTRPGVDNKKFKLIVTPVNDPPIAKNDTYTIDEDVSTIFTPLDNDIDVDGIETVKIVSITGDMAGSTAEISLDGKSILYTPAPDYYGKHEFQYTIEDDYQETSTAKITVTINAVNDKPIFIGVKDESDPYKTKEDTELIITVDVSDVETQAQALMLQASVNAGASLIEEVYVKEVDPLLPSQREICVVPAKDQNGTAKIKLLLSDGEEERIHFITIEIEPVNDPPVAKNDVASYTEDTPLYILESKLLENDTDVDIKTNGDFFTLVSFTDPSYGTIVRTTDPDGLPAFLYTPNHNSEKNDSFTYTIRDSKGAEATATVTLNCIPVNDPPVFSAVPDQTMLEDGTITVDLVFSDPETKNANLIVTASSSNPGVINSKGLIADAATGKLTITPLPDQFAEDVPVTITVIVSDGLLSVTRTFTVTVIAVPDAPVARDDKYETKDNSPITISPLDNDYDVDPDDEIRILSYNLRQPENGTLIANGDNTFTYISNIGVHGSQYIDYTIVDKTGLTATAVIEIVVESQGIGPMIMSIASIITYANEPIDTIMLKIANVPDDKPFSLEITSSNEALIKNSNIKIGGDSNHETGLIGTSQELDMVLEQGAIGETMITAILEYEGKTDKITFMIAVTRDNNAPTINPDAYTIKEGETVILDVLENDTDVQKPVKLRVLNFTEKPKHGSVRITADGKVEYKPNTWNGRYYFNGTDTFKYVAADGGGMTGEAEVTLTIEPMPTIPIAHRDSVYVEYGSVGLVEAISGMLNNDADYDDNYYDTPQEKPTMVIEEIKYVDTGTAPAFNISPDGQSMELVVPAPGWYKFNYKNRTKRYDASGIWDTSNWTELWVGVKDENGNVPPRIDAHSFSIKEDGYNDVTYSYRMNPLIHATNTDVHSIEPMIISSAITQALMEKNTFYEVSLFSLDPILENVEMKRVGDDVFLTFNTVQDKNGSTRINYKVTQNGVDSNESYITIYTEPVNDKPLISAIADTEAFRSDLKQMEITVTDVDNSHDDIMISVLSDTNSLIPSENITVTKKEGDNDIYILSFTPPRNEVDYMNRPVTITVTASDGDLTDSTSFKVIVKPKNNPPVVKPLSIESIDEDTAGEFNVIEWGYDVDGDVMSILCDNDVDTKTGLFLNGVYASDMGVLRTDTKKIIFVPKKDYYTTNGDVIEIRYKLKDLESESDLGVIRLTIDPVNDPPILYNLLEEYTMIEDASGYYIEYKVKDVDLDDLTFGADHDDPTRIKELRVVSEKVSDGDYTVKLYITPVKDACHNVGDTLSNITLWAKDQESTGSETVKLKIHPVNDPVEFKDGYSSPLEFEVDEDTTLKIDLCSYFTDPDGDVIKITAIKSVTHGSATNVENRLEFKPDKDYFTRDWPLSEDYAWLEFTVSDPYNGEYTGKIKINILPVNDAPNAPDFEAATEEDTVLIIDPMPGSGANKIVWDVDDELNKLVISAVTDPANGKAEIIENGRKIQYTPNLDWFGTDTIEYTIKDTGGLTDTGTIKIKVTPVPDDPRIAFYQEGNSAWSDTECGPDDTVWWEMDEDTPDSFQIRMWSPEPNLTNSLVLTIAARNLLDDNAHTKIIPRENVKLQGNGEFRTVDLTPLLNQFGELRLEFRLSDGTRTIYRYVNVRVNSDNDLPVIANQTAELDEDTSITKTITATDIETPASKLTYYLHGELAGNPQQPAHGIATVTTVGGKGEWTYTPDPDYFGKDSFKIDVLDEDGDFSTATISLKVKPINDAPEPPTNLAVDALWYKNGDTITVSFTAGTDKYNETARDDLTYIVETSINGGQSFVPQTITNFTPMASDGTITFTIPSPNGANTDQFQIRICTKDDDASKPLTSGWTVSSNIKIDNTKPVSTHILNPSQWTDGDVIIEITSTDIGPGATGIKVATGASIGILDAEFDLSAGKYKCRVSENGTYDFTIEDNVGNVDTYSIVVDCIDKLAPVISASPSSDNGTAVSPISVAMDYTDTAENAKFGMSGVKDSKYIVQSNDVSPTSGDTRWTDYASAITIDVKGTWYVAGKVTDVAGNETIQVFGPYTINNSVPIAKDIIVQVYEHTIDDTKKNTVDIKPVATDDDNDALTYTITSPLTPDFGTWETIANGHYRFTHNGDGAPPFENVLKAKYIVTDIDGANSNEAEITVNVEEVNDAPEAPTVTGPAKGSVFTGNGTGVVDETVELEWLAGKDEETAKNKLSYEIEVTYDDITWTPVIITGAGELSYSYACLPDKNSSLFRFRISTLDDNAGNQKQSEWSYSPYYVIDNTKPVVTHITSPTLPNYSNDKVTLALTVSDTGNGATGVKTVQAVTAGLVTKSENYNLGHFVYEVTENGIYQFDVTDKAGNKTVYKVTVNNIDKLAPDTDADIQSGTGNATNILTVTIRYTDAPADVDNVQSGVKDKKYILTADAATPLEDDSRWTDYTAPVTIGQKGTWYLYSKVTDNAGNPAIRKFGSYVMENSVPVAQSKTVEVYEHIVDGIKTNQVDFEFVATDDDNEALSYYITEQPDAKYGTLSKIAGSETKYRFIHSGYGKPTVDTPLYVKYIAKDTDGISSNEGVITINVVEVNDTPVPPVVTAPPAGTIYRGHGVDVDNGIVSLQWTAGDDEETGTSELNYEIEVTYGSNVWKPVQVTTGGAIGFDFKCPTIETTDKMQFRVRTVDNGVPSLTSTWAYSNIVKLDNIPPEIVYSAISSGSNYQVGDEAAYSIDVVFSYSDSGYSGLDVKKYVITDNNIKPMPAAFITLNKNQEAVRFEEIGVKYIHVYATDRAGNETYRCIGPFKIVNTPPVVNSQVVEVEEGMSIPIVLEGIDKDPGDSIVSYTVTSYPSYGTLDAGNTDREFVYTHNGQEDCLPDQIRFKVTDTYGVESAEGTVTINVIPVNDPPEIKDLPVQEIMPENTEKTITFKIFDPDDLVGSLKLFIQSSREDILDKNDMKAKIGADGTVTLKLKPKKDQYTNPGEPIILEFTVTDPHGEKVVVQMELEVTMVNQPPKTEDQFYLIVPGASVSSQIEATDRENDPIEFTVTGNPVNGTLTLDNDFQTNGKFHYEAFTDFPEDGKDVIEVSVTDGIHTVVSEVIFSGQIKTAEDKGTIDNLITIPDLAGVDAVSTKAASDNHKLIPPDMIEFDVSETGEVDLKFETLPDQFGIVNITLFVYTNNVELKQYTFRIQVQAENDEPKTEELVIEINPLRRNMIRGVISADDSIDQQFATSGFNFSCDNVLDQPLNGTVNVNNDGSFLYTPNPGTDGTDEFYVTVQEADNDVTNNPAPVVLPGGVVDIDTDDRLSVKAKVTIKLAQKVVEPEEPDDGSSSEGGSTGGGDSSGDSDSDSGNTVQPPTPTNPDTDKPNNGNESENSENGSGFPDDLTEHPLFNYNKDGGDGDSIWIPQYLEDMKVPLGVFTDVDEAYSNYTYATLIEGNKTSESVTKEKDSKPHAQLTESKDNNVSENKTTIAKSNETVKTDSQNEESVSIINNEDSKTDDMEIDSNENKPDREYDSFVEYSDRQLRGGRSMFDILVPVLVLFFLFILFNSRIVVIVETEVSGKERKRKKYVFWFHRVHHKDELILKFKKRNIIDFGNGDTTIRFGLFYRRKFYERDLTYIVNDSEMHTVVPEKKVYKRQKGVIL